MPSTFLVVDVPESGEQTFSTLRNLIAAATIARQLHRTLVMPLGFRRFNLSALNLSTTTEHTIGNVLHAHKASECQELPCDSHSRVVRPTFALLWSLGLPRMAESFGFVRYSAGWIAHAHTVGRDVGLPRQQYAAMHLRLEKVFSVFDVERVLRQTMTAMSAADTQVLFLASDAAPGTYTSKTFECDNILISQAIKNRTVRDLRAFAYDMRAASKRCQRRGAAEMTHVQLVAGLRAGGLQVVTLPRVALGRAARSIIDHILCSEAKLFIRPCTGCSNRFESYYQAWILQRRTVDGLQSVDVQYA